MSVDQRIVSSVLRIRLARDDLRALPIGWNGYGAEPVDAAIVDAVCRLIEQIPTGLTDPPQVVPMTRGRLQFEWHRGSRSLELEFEDPNRIHCLKWDSALGVEVEDVHSATDVIETIALMRWFASE